MAATGQETNRDTGKGASVDDEGPQAHGVRSALVAGSAMIDIIAVIAPENIERMGLSNEAKSYLLLQEGRKVPAQAVESHVGGGGCNAATALARLGWAPRLLAKLGPDRNADAVRAHLAENGVSDAGLRASEAATGVAIMIASHERNAGILVHRGANETLAPAEAADASLDGVSLLYIAPLSSDSADCFPYLAEAGRFAGAMVAANPGVRQLTSRGEAFFGALGNLDLLSVNAAELAALAPGLIGRGAKNERRPPLADDAPTLLRKGLHFAGFDLGLKDAMAALHGHGPRYVAVTDGADGAYLSVKQPDEPAELLFCPPAPAEVAGTAGAGDAWCSTLAASLAEGRSPAEALQRAASNAASVVERVNTSDGLLTSDALAARLATDAVTAAVV